jgi:ubiquinone/menaquinone biosynthesis C-methylase UbiE
MSADEALSRSFYANLGAEGLRRRTRPEWDAAIVELTAGYVGERERVLDVGCGYGRIAIPLAGLGYRVTGLDRSETLLRSGSLEARARGVRVQFVAGNMTRLPFRDESFDSVICLWSAFYEVLTPARQVQALAGMWRALRKGGFALIEGPLPPETDNELPADRISRGVVDGLPNAGYMHDEDTLSSRCAEADITNAEIFIRDWAGRDRMFLTFRRSD